MLEISMKTRNSLNLFTTYNVISKYPLFLFDLTSILQFSKAILVSYLTVLLFSLKHLQTILFTLFKFHHNILIFYLCTITVVL
jgi:hypothetical protein